jgi:DNA invertase Pin-like site-specific DNA recombinase
MADILKFDAETHRVIGPVGALPVAASDEQAQRFLMLLEGECLEGNISSVAQSYGFSRPRYYQILEDYKNGGVPALEPQKPGPKSNYRRTDQIVRQVLRHRFLDPKASPAVITQKLNQTQFRISLRSVHRIIADYGVQKKTLRTQPQKRPSAFAHSARRKANPARTSRCPQRGTRGSATPG